MGLKGSNYSQDELDNHSRNMNPDDDQYWASRGMEHPDDEDDDNHTGVHRSLKGSDYSQDELDNHSRNMNPEDDQYWASRGLERPDDDD